MFNRLLICAFLLVCLAPLHSAAAQEASASARAILRSDVRDKVVRADTLLEFRTRTIPSGRVDIDEGILRASYRVRHRVRSGLPPERAAIAHIEETPAYGIPDPDASLRLMQVRKGRFASHVTFEQTLAGVPVYNRQVKVNLDSEGQPTLVINGYAPHLEREKGFNARPRITAAEAAYRVGDSVLREIETTKPRLVVYPSKPPKLAWQMIAWPEDGSVEWEVLVDARSGEIIQLIDITLHKSADENRETRVEGREDIRREDVRTRSSILHPPSSTKRASYVDGLGLVFIPDPLSSAGVEYGGAYVDTEDQDAPELNAQRFEVVLRDISQGTDGLYRLQGPYVTIDGTCGQAYTAPAESSPDGFRYTRSSPLFEAVNIYYHVDTSQRYVQSLEVGFPIKETPVRANPRGLGTLDNARFRTGANCIEFGTGGIDDAEDADVIWHEYAHALLDHTVPGLLTSSEGKAFHEGWADYWAASYSRYLSEDDPRIPEHNWRKVFSWDGNLSCWQGRTLDHPGHYPDNTQYPTTGCIRYEAPYHPGLLWATVMMDIYDLVGREVMDRLHLASHGYLAASSRFQDFAQALIQADNDLYGGAHSNILIEKLSARGYIDLSNYGPSLVHRPVEASEDLGGSVSLEVTAMGATAAVDSVVVVYGATVPLQNRLVLTSMGADVYSGGLPLPSEPGRLLYYVEAVDMQGRRSRLPAGAPNETYVIALGPDAEPPTIVHDSPQHVSIVGWPLDLYAEVKDPFGVDSVWVEYMIILPDGSIQEEGTFGMVGDGDSFHGEFPSEGNKVQEGGAVSYRIHARDASLGRNSAVLPAEGLFRVMVVEQGVLRAFDFEGVSQGVKAGGVWQLGRPTFGLGVAHSGKNVWATAPSGRYPESEQLSSLELPSFDLSGAGSTYLVFWHWYDFEHDGSLEPGSYNGGGGLWDGGNVKISTDGGQTWTVIEPEGGYNGIVSSSHKNPLGGQRAFGGFSYGWRQEVFPLPAAANVRLRLDFGTDESNDDLAQSFAGWYIDDVMITAERPQDVSRPTASREPDMREVRAPTTDQSPQTIIVLQDDTGIESVIVEYVYTTDQERLEGRQRLAMAPSNLWIYRGAVAPAHAFEPGDRVEYRIVVKDFAGNESVFPATGSFVIDYRAAQQTNALNRLAWTGKWEWQGLAWGTSGASTDPVSSLVLEPHTLPSNSDEAAFEMRHSFNFGDGLGGNVKISTDDGKTWNVIEPQGGYSATLTGSHPMSGEGVFAGSSAGLKTALFDLSSYAGSEVRIRIDYARTRSEAAGEVWNVLQGSFVALSPDPVFETPRELVLNANFPDPFADQTTISYSIPEESPVRLSVFDMLGRRAALILHERQNEGTYTVTFDGSELANGVYMLYLETVNGTRTERMVIAR